MRRGVIIAFAVLGLVACGQKAETPKEGDPGPHSGAGAAAQPDVGAGANPDAASCLDLVANAKYDDAVPVCTRALNLDATNEKVKSALETATQKLSEAAGEAGDAAQEATDAAKQAIPKSY